MKDLGRSFGVRYAHEGGKSELVRRAPEGFDEVYSAGYTPDIPTRIPLFPPNTTVDDTVPTSLVQ